MCRLALLNKEGIKEIESYKGGLVGFLDYLEKANGGHGNGYVAIKDGKIIEHFKGVTLDNETIVCNLALLGDFDWLIYHTRITSQGSTTDNQCHPFVTKKKDFALCMNGTESEYGKIGKMLGTNDTDAIFRVYHALNIDEENLKDLSSKFVGFRKKGKEKGYVFFTNPKGYSTYNSTYYASNGLQLLDTKNKDAIVVASSFPTGVKCKSIKAGYIWREGKKIKLQESEKKETIYQKYSGRSDFDEYENGTYVWRSNKSEMISVGICDTCGHIDEEKTSGFCPECGKGLLIKSTMSKEYLDKIL